MSYILAISGPHISVIEAAGCTGQSLAQVFNRAKLAAGWPVAPNVRPPSPGELHHLRVAMGFEP